MGYIYIYIYICLCISGVLVVRMAASTVEIFLSAPWRFSLVNSKRVLLKENVKYQILC